ncbi:MAG: anthranilate phosphoribosyltransferase [Bacteroidota bacterium]
MIKQFIEKIIERENLAVEEAYQVMNSVMNGEVNNSLIAALLIALKSKGETAEEVAGFAKAMRDKSIKIKCCDENVIDVCGTGGDASGTFNISTAAAFVVSACGVKVAKHGNRAVSSNSGSADVLKELGINISLKPEQSEKALNEIGIAFLFAPVYHPAMKYAAPVRNELGMKTVFNILGPLTNPASTKKQLIGTFNERAAELMSNAVKYLDMKKVCFVCTAGRFDEITLTAETSVKEFSADALIKNYSVSNETFGYPKPGFEEIKGGSAKENAEIIMNIFEKKEKTPAYFVTAANAAMGLYCADYSSDIKICAQAAEEAINSGRAMEKLKALKSFSE